MREESSNKNITNLLKYVHYTNGANKLIISEKIGVSPAALTKISKKLITEKLLFEKSIYDEKGKKKNVILINYDQYISIGISIEKENIKINFTNLNCEILDSFEIEVENIDNFKKFIKYLFNSLKIYIKEKNIPVEKLIGIGVIASSEMINASILEFFKKERFAKLQEYSKEHFGIPIFLETDIRAISLYEAFINPHHRNFYLIRYGESRGTSLIINNKLIQPIIPYHRSLGSKHFIVETNSDIYCEICKKRGCFETMVAPKYLYDEIIKENNHSQRIIDLYSDMSFDTFMERAQKGGVTECKALRKIAKYITILMINHNTVFPLDKFLLSGKIFRSNLFVNYIKMFLQEYQLGEVPEELIVLEDRSKEESLAASFLPINYVFYNYNLNYLKDEE
nr:ROK family protein [uncultured Cetobacterium sp.]